MLPERPGLLISADLLVGGKASMRVHERASAGQLANAMQFPMEHAGNRSVFFWL